MWTVFLLCVFWCSGPSLADRVSRQNTPPVFDFKRDWTLPANEPVGSRITTVRTRDADGDTIKYGLEAAPYLDGSEFFTVDSQTGDVRLAKPLTDHIGGEYYFYVTAHDGWHLAKIEVYLRVTAPHGDYPLVHPAPGATLNSSNGPGAPLVAVTVVLVCLTLAAVGWVVLRHRCRGPRSNIDPPEKVAVVPHPDDHWEIPRHTLCVVGLLGEGCFGSVFKYELRRQDGSSQLVAVKTLKMNAAEKEKQDLLSELRIMKMLDPHPNVVALLGCCTEKDPVYVVMEYVSQGKLQDYLRKRRKQLVTEENTEDGLTSQDLTSFAYQVAKGMEYIVSKGVIHRDLAARNVLVGDNKICKVADFGFARDVTSSTQNIYERKSEGKLPIRWMAPESLFENYYTAKTDVWSFGILMWEIVTLGSMPYPGLTAGDVMRQVNTGLRLEKPEHCGRELYNVMYYCWDADPDKRPDFTELVNSLDALLVQGSPYVALDRFPDHAYYNLPPPDLLAEERL